MVRLPIQIPISDCRAAVNSGDAMRYPDGLLAKQSMGRFVARVFRFRLIKCAQAVCERLFLAFVSKQLKFNQFHDGTPWGWVVIISANCAKI